MRNLNAVELDLISGGVTEEQQQELDDSIFGREQERHEQWSKEFLESIEFPEY